VKRVFLILCAVAALAVALPALAQATTVRGVVVEKNASRGTIAVASATGVVRTLHVAKLALVGARVSAAATQRADGTFTASRVTVTGRANSARIHGVVAARASGRLLLSAGHSMILVRAKLARRALAGGGPPPPITAGTTVNTTVGIKDNGELDEEHTTATGNQAIVEVEGTVTNVTATSFDVKTEGGLPVTIQIPSGTTVTVAVGDDVELKADLQGSTLTLVSLDDSSNSNNGDSGSGGGSGSSGGGSSGGGGGSSSSSSGGGSG